MGFSFRPGRVKLGPLNINLGQVRATANPLDPRSIVSSVSIGDKAGSMCLWGRDTGAKPRINSINTPGPGSLRRN